MKIKFCGLRDPRDASYADSLGAVYGGVILTRSIRQVTPGQARAIFEAAPSLKRVGVVGHEPVPQLLVTAKHAELDVLQLHGVYRADEYAQLRQEFEGQIWTVIPLDAATGQPDVDWKQNVDYADAILLDTGIGGRSGGTGRTFNWAAAAPTISEIKRQTSIVLAGGLNPENVTRAIEQVSPAAVDVSSGVESSPGIKSHELMAAFARSVLSASIV